MSSGRDGGGWSGALGTITDGAGGCAWDLAAGAGTTVTAADGGGPLGGADSRRGMAGPHERPQRDQRWCRSRRWLRRGKPRFLHLWSRRLRPTHGRWREWRWLLRWSRLRRRRRRRRGGAGWRRVDPFIDSGDGHAGQLQPCTQRPGTGSPVAAALSLWLDAVCTD